MDKTHITRVATASGLTTDQVVRCLKVHTELVLKKLSVHCITDNLANDRWWELFLYEVKGGGLKHGRDFRIADKRLHLRWHTCHKVYTLNHLRVYGERGLDRRDMMNLLRASDAFVRIVRSMKLENVNTSVVAFALDQLPPAVFALVSNPKDPNHEPAK